MPRKRKQQTDAYNKALPSRLRALMDEKGTTQIDLGKAVGVSRQSISYYCDGSSSPTWEGIVAIADYFDVNVDWLLGRPGSARRKDIDLDAVCKYTGLSSLSARMLHNRTGYGQFLSQIIENHPNFTIIMNSIEEILQYKTLEHRPEYKEYLERAKADEEFNAACAVLDRHYYQATPLDELKDLEEAKAKKAFARIIDSLKSDWTPRIDLYPDKYEKAFQSATLKDIF